MTEASGLLYTTGSICCLFSQYFPNIGNFVHFASNFAEQVLYQCQYLGKIIQSLEYVIQLTNKVPIIGKRSPKNCTFHPS